MCMCVHVRIHTHPKHYGPHASPLAAVRTRGREVLGRLGNYGAMIVWLGLGMRKSKKGSVRLRRGNREGEAGWERAMEEKEVVIEEEDGTRKRRRRKVEQEQKEGKPYSSLKHQYFQCL